uniref:Uncharacterized protein n=1 Tax=Candidatus Kentrum sp. FW TaxID=2126338 RepID=A0A450TA56_9GAMM|nr:MAG: hypothetical protein BECKFW1821C_GA0114237_100439 [Candidatus Kentron sp. FW]
MWQKPITLIEAIDGRPPMFGGNGQMVHDNVKWEMLRV